mmetsp:Transcript_24571/g.57073  ORF Transcript_24571/g.57073 Transcript_24571/m.57073 type:complete len:948 (+) Transcript_24571:99-2942(+)
MGQAAIQNGSHNAHQHKKSTLLHRTLSRNEHSQELIRDAADLVHGWHAHHLHFPDYKSDTLVSEPRSGSVMLGPAANDGRQSVKMALAEDGTVFRIPDDISEITARMGADYAVHEVKVHGEGRALCGRDAGSWLLRAQPVRREAAEGNAVRSQADKATWVPYGRVISALCAGEEQITNALIESFRSGAEFIRVILFEAVLELRFQKSTVVEEHETASPHELLAAPDATVATMFAWGVEKHFMLAACLDPLQYYFIRAHDKKVVKTQDLMDEIAAADPPFPEVEVRRFLRWALDDELQPFGRNQPFSRTVASPYERMWHSAHHAASRHVLVLEDQEAHEYVTPAAPKGYVESQGLPAQGAAARMMKKVRKALGKSSPQTWELVVGWEPLHLQKSLDWLKLAHRSAVLDDEDRHLRHAHRAMELFNKEAIHAAEPRGRFEHPTASPKLTIEDVDLLFFASKHMVSSVLDGFHKGQLERETMELRLQELCEKMLVSIDTSFQHMAERMTGDSGGKSTVGKDLLSLCLRTKADYLRYLSVLVPSAARDTAVVREAYESALRVTQGEPARLQSLLTRVNYAVYWLEMENNDMEATNTCKAGLERITDHALDKMTSDEVINHRLLRSNLMAVETSMLIFAAVFHHEALKKHAEAIHFMWQADDRVEQEAIIEQKHREEEERTWFEKLPCFNEALAIEGPPPKRHTERDALMQAVLNWIRSRPCCKEHDFRWIEHAEEVSLGDEPKCVGLKDFRDERAENEGDQSRSPAFFISTLHHDRMYASDNGDQDLVRSITEWPATMDRGTQVRLCKVTGRDEIRNVLYRLNPDGVVMDRHAVGESGYNLFPGDLLVRDTNDTVGRTVADLLANPPFTITFKFLPCPSVKFAGVVSKGPYAEVQEKFAGFRTELSLTPSPEFKSLHAIAAQFAHPRKRRRQFRGLSARRRGEEAILRGCT